MAQPVYKDFADLPPIFKSKEGPEKVLNDRTERNREYTEPVYLKKLWEYTKNMRKTGEMIGVSHSLVGTALRDNEVTLVTELAAQAVYLRDIEPPPPPAPPEMDGKILVSMLIEKEALKSLKPWLEQSGVTFKIFH